MRTRSGGSHFLLTMTLLNRVRYFFWDSGNAQRARSYFVSGFGADAVGLR
jgi:hypothetical protein